MPLSTSAIILNCWMVSERLIQLCDENTSRSIADEGWENFMGLGLAPTITQSTSRSFLEPDDWLMRSTSSFSSVGGDVWE